MDHTAKIIKTSYAPCDQEVVLESCKGEFSDVLVIGQTPQGELEVYSSSYSRSEITLWLLKRLEHKLLAGEFDG